MHDKECIWQTTKPEDCSYRLNHSECPHIEHSCTCQNLRELRKTLKDMKDSSKNSPTTSSPEEQWTTDLVNAIKHCRLQNQDMRFGQLIYNLIAANDEDSEDYQENFHSRLFYIEDGDLAKLIEKYGKSGKL